MTNDEKTTYWIELSDYDLETADAMFQTKRYLYVGFMCHQAVEKIFKALYVKQKGETPPYTHKLIYLARHGDFYDFLDEKQINFVLEIEPLNIETRYPEYKERLMKRLVPLYCEDLIGQTKTLQQWIKKQL
ncbi:MAG: HEPN domain-containing protein [Tannerella sp.]|jgi:HEPN domain-containing protein|nr:HEPN domain-containing protein [Tannerella sp.]